VRVVLEVLFDATAAVLGLAWLVASVLGVGRKGSGAIEVICCDQCKAWILVSSAMLPATIANWRSLRALLAPRNGASGRREKNGMLAFHAAAKNVEEWGTLRCTRPRFTAGTGCRYRAPLSTCQGGPPVSYRVIVKPGSAP
jgi:hypothetical protein